MTVRLAVAVAVVLAALAGGAGADAQARGCAASVNGADVGRYSSWRDPLVVHDDETLRIAGTASTVVTDVEAHVLLPFGSQRIAHVGTEPGARWEGEVPIADVARLTNGLHHIEVTAGECRIRLWIDVRGSAPLATPASIAGIVLVLAGVGRLAFALRAAASGRRAPIRSALSGAVAGGGALLLANQLGQVPLTTGWVASWVIAPGGVGALLNLAVSSVRPPPAPAPPPAATRAAPPPAAGPAPAPPAPAASRATTGAAPPMPTGAAPPMPTGAAPPMPSAATSGPAAPEADPPRSAYARLEAPESVVAERAFTATVGLSPEPVAGVAGPELVRPPSSVGAYDLTVQVVADGFTIADADAKRVLRVTAAEPYPTFTPTLTPNAIDGEIAARCIQAIYAIDGHTIGFAVRPVAVVATDALLDATPRPPAAEAGVVAIPSRETAPDVTIRIIRGADQPGRLLWTLESPHPGVTLPAQAATSDIGDEPEAFARKLVGGVSAREGTDGVDEFLRGAGLTITEQIPIEVTDALATAAAAVGERPLTVFLLSEEPYVPWELAVIEPPLRAGAPPFLGAQVELGRWVLGQRRPPLPPPRRVEVSSMAVIGGVYDGTAARLFEAEAEAKALAAKYDAVVVDALTGAIIDCLGGRPPAEVLHFAVHGMYDAAAVKEGLVLLDGSLLDPFQVKGARVQGAPFVFLNACQVGSGNELLGDYAGVAQAFLYAGAAAVIAPLWSVNDITARELALSFYEATLDGRSRPAAVLREKRAEFDADARGPASATLLAYQLFGHPDLTLTRRG